VILNLIIVIFILFHNINIILFIYTYGSNVFYKYNDIIITTIFSQDLNNILNILPDFLNLSVFLSINSILILFSQTLFKTICTIFLFELYFTFFYITNLTFNKNSH